MVPAVTQEVDDLTRPIYGDVLVGYEKLPLLDENGQPVKDAAGNPIMVDDPSKPIYQKGVIGYEKKIIEVTPAHEEYEEGWRDGDFSYDDD